MEGSCFPARMSRDRARFLLSATAEELSADGLALEDLDDVFARLCVRQQALGLPLTLLEAESGLLRYEDLRPMDTTAAAIANVMLRDGRWVDVREMQQQAAVAASGATPGAAASSVVGWLLDGASSATGWIWQQVAGAGAGGSETLPAGVFVSCRMMDRLVEVVRDYVRRRFSDKHVCVLVGHAVGAAGDEVEREASALTDETGGGAAGAVTPSTVEGKPATLAQLVQDALQLAAASIAAQRAARGEDNVLAALTQIRYASLDTWNLELIRDALVSNDPAGVAVSEDRRYLTIGVPLGEDPDDAAAVSNVDVHEVKVRLLVDKYEKRLHMADRKMHELRELMLTLHRAGDRQGALLRMKQLKMRQKFRDRLSGALLRLHETVLAIEHARMNAEVFDSLKDAAASLQSLRDGGPSLDDVDDVLDVLDMEVERADEIASAMQQHSLSALDADTENDSSLLAELELLEQQVAQQQKQPQIAVVGVDGAAPPIPVASPAPYAAAVPSVDLPAAPQGPVVVGGLSSGSDPDPDQSLREDAQLA